MTWRVNDVELNVIPGCRLFGNSHVTLPCRDYANMLHAPLVACCPLAPGEGHARLFVDETRTACYSMAIMVWRMISEFGAIVVFADFVQKIFTFAGGTHEAFNSGFLRGKPPTSVTELNINFRNAIDIHELALKTRQEVSPHSNNPFMCNLSPKCSLDRSTLR